jgi:uncharacterized protein YjdB
MRVADRMKSMSPRRIGAASLLAMLAATTGCLDLRTTPDACTVTVAPTTLTLRVNGSAPIVGTAFDCNGNSIRNKRISYSSANSAVANVTIEGTVIAVGVGSTSVSAVADGKTASVQVTVTPEAATAVTISPTTLTLRKTNTRQLTATARNNQNLVITGRTFRWSSSNSAIVAIDQNGQVTALAPGQVVIAAEADQAVGNATIIVTEIPIGSCSLAPVSSRVTVSQSVQPTLTLRDTANNILPSLGRSIVWSSSNEVVATVTQSGLATTRRAGTATITASPAENPQITCSTSVEAVDPRITQVVITPRTGSLRLGIPRGFGAALLDSTSNLVPAGRITTWSTNTPTVVQVTQAGIVTGISLGTARIIASSEGVADTVTLQVTQIPVGSIAVTPLQAAIFEGQTVQIRATVKDSVGTEVTDRPIEWLTSDPLRATVSNTGLVTAISAGTVNVGATTEGRLAQSTVVIQQVPADTILVGGSFTVNRGATSAFEMVVRDAAGNRLLGRNVIVTSDFPNIAIGQPNTQGTLVTVSGIALGEATLTLQAVDANGRSQGKRSTVRVTVQAPPTGGLRSSVNPPTP